MEYNSNTFINKTLILSNYMILIFYSPQIKFKKSYNQPIYLSSKGLFPLGFLPFIFLLLFKLFYFEMVGKIEQARSKELFLPNFLLKIKVT